MKSKLSVILLIWLLACVQPYDFEPKTFDKVLVIEGGISDQLKYHQISLSYTYPMGAMSFQQERVTDATVKIQTEAGMEFEFMEIEPGKYRSLDSIAAVAETAYRISIETSNNNYESEWQYLSSPASIEKLYPRLEQVADEVNDVLNEGLQFFVDSKTEDGSLGYFRFEWESTGLVKVPFPSNYEIKEGNWLPTRREKALGTCYRHQSSDQVIVGTTLGTSEARLLEFPIHYVPADSQDLRLRYSIKVNQYAITADEFQYLKKLKENNETSGSLFDRERGTVIGNVFSTLNENETVLGYFEVARETSKRIFVDRTDFPQIDELRFPVYCTETDADLVWYGDARAYLAAHPDKLIWGLDYSIVPMTAYAVIFDKECSSCSDYADPDKPEFWKDQEN